MKCLFPPAALFLVSLACASAQVASHAPVLQAPATPATAPAARPVARVNGAVLTEMDLLSEEFAIFPYARQHGGIPKEMEPGVRSGALKMMIFEELVYQEARRRGMTIPAADMQTAEARFRKQFSSPDEYRAYLHNQFQDSLPHLREKIRRSLLIDALLKIEVENKCKPTLAEMRDFYEKNPTRFEHPEKYTFQTISILPPPNATAAQLAEDRARAEKALAQAKATRSTEEFGILAEKVSDDDYRVVLGQHKPVEASALPPDVLKTLQAMKPGEVSNLVQVEKAIAILRLNVHTPAGKDSFESARPGLEKELTEIRRADLRSTLGKKLSEGAKIEQM